MFGFFSFSFHKHVQSKMSSLGNRCYLEKSQLMSPPWQHVSSWTSSIYNSYRYNRRLRVWPLTFFRAKKQQQTNKKTILWCLHATSAYCFIWLSHICLHLPAVIPRSFFSFSLFNSQGLLAYLSVSMPLNCNMSNREKDGKCSVLGGLDIT